MVRTGLQSMLMVCFLDRNHCRLAGSIGDSADAGVCPLGILAIRFQSAGYRGPGTSPNECCRDRHQLRVRRAVLPEMDGDCDLRWHCITWRSGLLTDMSEPADLLGAPQASQGHLRCG